MAHLKDFHVNHFFKVLSVFFKPSTGNSNAHAHILISPPFVQKKVFIVLHLMFFILFYILAIFP